VSLRQVEHHAQPPLGQLVDLLSDLVQGTQVGENATRRKAIPHLRGRSGGRTWNARTVIAGLAARLAHGRTVVYAIVDRDLLRICTRCDEIVYPREPDRRGTVIYQQPSQPSRCQFCGGSELATWNLVYQSELEYGPGRRLLGSELTSAEIDGLMDDHDNERGERGRL
jgi:hypothetical protein